MREVVDALDAAFYAAFENVEPTGKRLLLALDVSGSMALRPGRRRARAHAARRVGGAGAGHGGNRAAVRDRRLLRRSAAAAASPVDGRFAGRADGLTPLAISPRQRLDDAVKAVSDLPFGGTDCALPMLLRAGAASERSTRS